MMKKSSLSVLLLLTLTPRGRAQGIDTPCCNLQNCKNVTTLPLTLAEYISSSPYYGTIFSTPDRLEITNLCVTYFNITRNTCLGFTTFVNTDGTYTVHKYIKSDLPGQTGVLRVQGQYGDLGNETTVYNLKFVDVACSSCQPILVSYECFLFDTVEYVNYKYDTVFGLSSSMENSPSCLDQFKKLVDASGLQVEGLVTATGDPKCVVYFNNATCINADRIDPAYAISYP